LSKGYVVGTIKDQPREQVKSQIIEELFFTFRFTAAPLLIVSLAAGKYEQGAMAHCNEPCDGRPVETILTTEVVTEKKLVACGQLLLQ